MGSVGPFVLLGITLLCFIIGLAGLIFGCVGDSWWVLDTALGKTETGLWRYCTKGVRTNNFCKTRDDLFDFDGVGNSAKFDTILIVLMASAVFCFLAFLSTLLMICYRRRIASWRCAASVSFTIGLIGALAGIGALGYAEYEFDTVWEVSSHGTAALFAWIGTAAQLLGAVLSSILVCVMPTPSENKQTVHYVGNTNPTYQMDY